MTLAKIFQSGDSQAARLPKEFRMTSSTVEISQRGDEIVLREIPESALTILAAFTRFPDDLFKDGRKDTIAETRQSLL
jgi:antitoxin VapB